MLGVLATQLLSTGALKRAAVAASSTTQLYKQGWACPSAPPAVHSWRQGAPGCRAMAAGRGAGAKDEEETSAAGAAAAASPFKETQQEARRLGSLLYQFAVHGQPRVVRLATWSIIFAAMLARSWRLFKRELGMLALVELLLCDVLGAPVALGGSLALLLLALVDQARRNSKVNIGHRAGAEGYEGDLCENSIQSLQALAALDNGPKGGKLLSAVLQYVEIDVQETADGQLVVMHDEHLRRSFPEEGPNVAALGALRAQGVHVGKATVQELTLPQLQSLHLGAHEGVHVPTLRAFMQAYKACCMARPLVVEVKLLQSDAGRARLLEDLKWYKPHADMLAARHPERRHARLGFLAVISFPHMYAASFGEFGSPACRRWTKQLVNVGLPVRCCVLDAFSLAYGTK